MRRRVWGWVWLALSASCGVAEDGGVSEVGVDVTERDALASCEGFCGGKSPSGCWCDESCVDFGNCCADVGLACFGEEPNTSGDEPPTVTCEGACGGQAEAGCWCDASCTDFGNCCPDFQALCEQIQEPGEDPPDEEPPGEEPPGEVPSGDDPWGHLSDGALRAALRQFTSQSHDPLGYETARGYVLGQFGEALQSEDGKLGCLYTGKFVAPDGSAEPGGQFNVEHVWPQSLGADRAPRRSDMHHLFPSTRDSNSVRGSWWFGESDCVSDCDWADGGSKRGRDDENHIVFDVRPVSRGEVARAVFYFAVRYGYAVDPWVETVLRAWHRGDPPDARERARNDRIEELQGNRNPFIDYPQVEARVSDF